MSSTKESVIEITSPVAPMLLFIDSFLQSSANYTKNLLDELALYSTAGRQLSSSPFYNWHKTRHNDMIQAQEIACMDSDIISLYSFIKGVIGYLSVAIVARLSAE